MSSEKRKFKRHGLTRFVWYQTIELDGAAPASGVSYLVDVSVGGLGLAVKEPLRHGALLFVKAVFENPQHNLSVVGRVAYCREAADKVFTVGIEFVAVPPDSQKFLAEHFG